MKTLLLFFFSVLCFQNTQAQKVDVVNAPRNPIGFKHKKAHFLLRGDIYASAGKIFDKAGNLQYNFGTRYYYDNSGKIIGNNYGDIFEYDSQGNITKFQYQSGSTSLYKFNSENLLIYEKSSYGDEKTYTYDTQGRLIKTSIKKNGKLSQEQNFSYGKKRDSLIVNIEYTYTNGRRRFLAESYYRNGFLVKEIVSSGTYRYKVKIDSKGNKIDFYNIDDPNAKHFETVNRYYSDAKKNLNIEYGYHKLSSSKSAKKSATIYVDGKRCTDIAISKGIKPNEKVVYDGLTQTYYSVPNIIPENHTLDTRIPISTKLSVGNPYMSYAYDGKFINYIDGYNKVKSRDFAFLGPHMIDYRIDKYSGRTYIIRNYKNTKEKPVKPIELLTTDTTSILYARQLKDDNFFIVVKGKHIDYKKARFEYLTNGDPVIFIDNTPKYVLTGFRLAQENEVLFGRFYNDELKNSKISSSIDSSNDLECLEGDCKEGWGKIKVGDIITQATFNNGAIDGLAYINYPENSFFHGEYKNNLREGVGYYKWSNGNSYIGHWQNGKQHGLGIRFDKNDNVIEAGRFENGTLVENQSESYKNNIKNGNCLGNCSNGFGKYTYSNGDSYLGFFKNNQRFSIGSYSWVNNSSYMGTYTSDGKRNGYGIYTYVDTSVFRGIFFDDKIAGLGIMKYAKSGNSIKGVFNNKGARIRDF
ncbi:MORN motif precursor [Winogradskyella sp.]|uniref:MORN repeat-containing protein n=1 Tax=Winogradskyella sp. TaxID=1883156 RepID=UPI002617D5BF|nr:MORN motif precursor [Winogradskyella sp.]